MGKRKKSTTNRLNNLKKCRKATPSPPLPPSNSDPPRTPVNQSTSILDDEEHYNTTDEEPTFENMQRTFQLDGSRSPVKGAPIRFFCEFQIVTEADCEVEDSDIPSLDDVGPDSIDLLDDADEAEDEGSDGEESEDGDIDIDNEIQDIDADGEDWEMENNPFENEARYETETTGFGMHGALPGKLREAPTQIQASSALADINHLLFPKRRNHLGEECAGHTDPGFNSFKRSRIEGMRALLNLYTNCKSETYNRWGRSSCTAAISFNRGCYCAHQFRFLTRQFIRDRTLLPINPYGTWNHSMLVDEDLVNDVNLYLQELGDGITAKKLVDFLAREDVKAKHGIRRTITERTARRYLQTLGYRWRAAKKGQYVDGHEREDVVAYREKTFLPAWQALQDCMHNWSTENLPEFGPHRLGRRVIVWFHDESVFYAHDRRRRLWVHKDAPAKPYAKGDGASLMFAQFVSADFGWLAWAEKSAQRVMKPGKNKDGYFSNDDIIEQVHVAMDMVSERWPEFEHVFIYDNASTHLKRPDDSISARKMPKHIPKQGTNWGVEVIRRDKKTKKPVLKTTGKPEKDKIPMGDARFTDGTPQPLYFPRGHRREGIFKGMQIILEERGFENAARLPAECKGFKCKSPTNDCCCRRILFTQPDFANIPSILETACQKRGFKVIFLPKFHCELNFIEQCWGFAKRIYRLNPESSREDHLEKNAREALESVPLVSMRRFANQSRRFMDAYSRGLNGRQAAWASRKYRGHRVLPESLMDELEKAHIV
ncbi:hypothetical protein BDN70DRAFT_998814 [Pholiota conissans]|uniref:Uncharacterized protein n=1 Tax=Pholiota conissans TaxID=109636 RepID=A0A9P5YLN0_9AGAR|nr:hypothetical protein BDN70DRAFT_998814 [Pholiota conissans]